MLMFFQPWVNHIFILAIGTCAIYKTVDVYHSLKPHNSLMDSVVDFLNGIVFGGIFTVGCGLGVYGLTVLLLNAFSTYPPRDYIETYNIQSSIELPVIYNEDTRDYYLFEDNNTHEYIFGTTNTATGNVIECRVDFNHSIIVPSRDCNQPMMLTVHNDHNYTQDHKGNLFSKPQFYESDIVDTNNDNYSELYVFIIPVNSVYEYVEEIEDPVVA